ncbi:hypothetical protein Pyrfu_0279 [Pyrolobus fumarii 1A]|uniref:Uncharacterized protein n=1 Tax=Pyrolobus fumarii (strain DSM 11204 / 1A) TaxID=694429 RepID=G0EFA8_PYRF1|nr:hypothetical protein [Pyrolobus fumarii]AEM38151.1 hypothetical protein Pyrfu_0279 [Pyrolobus fumarii 1A]
MTVDENEVRKFVEWLPEISEDEAYVVQVMLRPWKPSHTNIPKSGLLHLEVIEGGDGFRERLFDAIVRAALLASNAGTVFRVAHHGRMVRVPPDAVAVYTRVNPSLLIRAATRLCIEHIEYLQSAAYSGKVEYSVLTRRIASVLAREIHTRFHIIDVDDDSIVDNVVAAVEDIVGYVPPRIKTRRGLHILVPVSNLDANRAKKWFREVLPMLMERYRGLIEYKREGLEPTPGTVYKGVVVRLLL